MLTKEQREALEEDTKRHARQTYYRDTVRFWKKLIPPNTKPQTLAPPYSFGGHGHVRRGRWWTIEAQ